MVSGWFVTGTDTGVGKTCVSAALLRTLAQAGHRVAGMKPVASGAGYRDGNAYWEDVEALALADGQHIALDDRNPYRFEPAIAPHLAAQRAGVVLDKQKIITAFHRIAATVDKVVVEGAGGWYVPLGDAGSMAALARHLGLPVILVVGMRLGCINHALLSARAIQADGCQLAGWVANLMQPDMPMLEENMSSLQQLMPAPLLAIVPWQAEQSPPKLHFLATGNQILR